MFTICRGLCRGLGVRPGGSGWSGGCLKGCWLVVLWKRPGLASSCWLSLATGGRVGVVVRLMFCRICVLVRQAGGEPFRVLLQVVRGS